MGCGGFNTATHSNHHEDCSAFYFEEYTAKMRRNIEHNPRVCLMSVNSDGWFWFRSLLKGRFASAPGVRLLGLAGERAAPRPSKSKPPIAPA